MKTVIVSAVAAAVLMGCGKMEESPRKSARSFTESFRECIDRNTKPDKVHVIPFDSPEKLADHCTGVAEREERDAQIRAAAREKYL